MRISDWSSDVCSSDLAQFLELWRNHIGFFVEYTLGGATGDTAMQEAAGQKLDDYRADFGAFIESATDGELTGDVVAENLQMHVDMLIRSEEHTSELQSLMRNSYAVFCLKKKK